MNVLTLARVRGNTKNNACQLEIKAMHNFVSVGHQM